MSKAEHQANRYTGYCKNQCYADFLAGYMQAVEDTAEWLKKYSKDYISLETDDEDCDIVCVYRQKDMIADFKKYMKDK